MWDREAPTPGACSRRDFFRSGINLAAAGSAGLWLAGCATRGGATLGPFERAARPALSGLAALAAIDEQNGGADPFPIPWLDKNGSHNQAPGPNQEPSSIFHFKGRVARSNGFTGVGTDNAGRRIAFGTNTTDYSFMQGVYWAGRRERTGAFTHT